MQFADAARQLNPDVYQRLRRSLELGKWPDGRIMTPEQKTIAMEAVIVYEQSNQIPETERVGYMESACKSKSSGAGAGSSEAPSDEPAPLKFVDDRPAGKGGGE